MKKSSFIFAGLTALFGLAFVNFQTNTDMVVKETISFYQTNLVCGAAPDFGCGSRSKPILLDFERNEKVKEAWLNRAGTVIAVVWEDGIEAQSPLSEEIFANHTQAFTELTGEEYKEQLHDFNTGQWYKGAEVDKLSIEESGRIAGLIMDPLVEKGDVSPEIAPQMRADMEDYIKKELLAIDDAGVLYDVNYWKRWEKELMQIGEKHLGEGNMPEIQFTSAASASCNKEEKAACCSKDSHGSSCTSSKAKTEKAKTDKTEL